MLATYGVDVLDPNVTPRRLAVLLDRLPPYARRPGQQWSIESELLAALIDHVANLTWVTLRAAGAKNARRPRPLPRPAERAAIRAPAQGARNSRAIPASTTGTWADAIKVLAGLPGVTVRGGDADG